MKYFIKSTYSLLIASVVMLFVPVKIKAQSVRTDSTTNQLVKVVSISPEKATQLKAALNIHQREIIAIINDNTLTQDEKQNKITGLLADRQNKVDVIVNKAQKKKLSMLRSNNSSIQAERIKQWRQSNEALLKGTGVKQIKQ